MIDICNILRVYNKRFPGKMVTIQRKNLFASCLFLLVHSFILAVSGSYDNSVSGLFVNELESEKQDTEWLTNHQEDLLKGNYVTRRRKSRSTLEENSEGEKTEETSPKIRRKWKPRRKRKFKRSLLPESIENATSTINSIEDSSDVINNATTIKANGEEESLKVASSKEKLKNNGSTDETYLKPENRSSKENDGKMGFRSLIPRLPVNMNVVAEFQKRIIGTDLITLIRQFVKEILHRVDYHLHYRRTNMTEKEEKNQFKKMDKDKLNVTKQENEKGKEEKKEKEKKEKEKEEKEKEKKQEEKKEKEKEKEEKEKEGNKEEVEKKDEKKNKKQENKDEKKEKKEEDEKKKDEKKEKDEKKGKDEKKEKGEKKGEKKKEDEDNDDDFKKSKEDDRITSIISSSDIKLFQIIPDVFLPTIKDIIENKIFPWKALASKQYIMEVSKERGAYKKQTTKETKSKVSLFYVSDPNDQKTDDKEQLENLSNLNDLKNESENHEENNNDKLCELIQKNIDALKKNDNDENAVYDFIIIIN